MSHWIWKPLGWVIALVVASGVALWIYKKQSYKALSYRVVSISPLGPLQAQGFADLRLLKGDKPIERPFLTTIRITNTGDLSIAPGDFANPLSFKPVRSWFSGSESKSFANTDGQISMFKVPYKGLATFAPQVVDARVASSSPPKIPIELVVKGAELQVQPLLLNVGDEFTIEVLINGDVGGIEVGGRIAGIRAITEEKQLTMVASENKRVATESFGYALGALMAAFVVGFFGSIRLTVPEDGVKVEKRIPAVIGDVGVMLCGVAIGIFVVRGIWLSGLDMMNILLAVTLLFASVVAVLFWLKSR